MSTVTDWLTKRGFVLDEEKAAWTHVAGAVFASLQLVEAAEDDEQARRDLVDLINEKLA